MCMWMRHDVEMLSRITGYCCGARALVRDVIVTKSVFDVNLLLLKDGSFWMM